MQNCNHSESSRKVLWVLGVAGWDKGPKVLSSQKLSAVENTDKLCSKATNTLAIKFPFPIQVNLFAEKVVWAF